MKMRKWLARVVCLILLLSTVMNMVPAVDAASGPSITTTLEDGITQRGSKKTFDVWARNGAGEKIKATVTFNGEKLEPTWDDSDKASYTLHFTKEGENIVVVSASSDGGRKKTLTYHINYIKAAPGEAIGTAVWSVEMFTIGAGFLIEPVEVDIYEGETAAEQLIRLLHESGFVAYYGGTTKASFYLAYIADGDAASAKYNSYQKSGTPATPKKLDVDPQIPAILELHLEETMTFYDPEDYTKNWEGYLGEFAFTNGSGWMYSVNNIFPNVGFADSYPSDGDVIRVQFTLGYGADIGGFGATGTVIPDVDNQPTSGYFDVANKDALVETIFQALSSGHMDKDNVARAYTQAMSAMEALDASQTQTDNAVDALKQALADPKDDPASPESTESQQPTESQEPTDSQNPTVSQEPTEGQKPTDNPEPTQGTEESTAPPTDPTDSADTTAPSTGSTEDTAQPSTEATEPSTQQTEGTTASPSEGEESKATKPSVNTQPADGDNTENETGSWGWIIPVAACVLAAGGAGVYFYLRKKQEGNKA